MDVFPQVRGPVPPGTPVCYHGRMTESLKLYHAWIRPGDDWPVPEGADLVGSYAREAGLALDVYWLAPEFNDGQ